MLALVVAFGLQDPQSGGGAPPSPTAPQGVAPGTAQAPQPMSLPAIAVCRRGQRPIEIDGSLIDWPELPLIDLGDVRQVSGTAMGAWHNKNDLSGYAFVLWDETYLYFAAAIKDEWHRALDPDTFTLMETPVADSIVLSIDPERDTRSLGPDPGRADDVELWLGDEASHEVLQWDRLRGTATLLDAAGGGEGAGPELGGPDESRLVVSHDKERSVTSYEMRVAWSRLLLPGRKPAAGTVFDLQIVVNDFDEGTDPMPQTRIGWTFGCGIVADPCLFGAAILVDDDGSLKSGLPPLPARRDVPVAEVLHREHWLRFQQALRAHPPAVHDGSKAPEEAGGMARFDLLRHLDAEIGRYPRVDFVEFCQRAHRRMQREVAGIEQYGIPAFWEMGARQVAKEAADPALAGTARLFRLPQNGWLVRGEKYAFLVDPAGARAATNLWGATDFVLLSEPLDMARRSDQLLIRMNEAKPPRPWFAHIAFHLPGMLMQEMPLVSPYDSRLQPSGVTVHAIGEQRADGRVPFAMGYEVALPGKLNVLFAGAALRPEDLPNGRNRCQWLVLTARNPAAVELARTVAPDLVLIDGAFGCFQLPGVARVELRMAHALQKVLLPLPSLLLAPGESWELARGQ